MIRLRNLGHFAGDRRRYGFTLLEIVLALGLSSLLLVALYTALQMHWSSSALGHVEMERAQVARALFRRMETDLRSVVFRDTPLESSTDDGSTSASGDTSSTASTSGTGGATDSSTATTGSTDSTTTTTTETYSTQKTGLFGDSESLVVHLSLPTRASSLSAASGSTAGGSVLVGSDLQSVVYFMAGSSSSFAQQLSGSLVSPTGKAAGLARLQGDRMAMQAADESGDMSSMSSGVQLLAPEVASIAFEYFDGVSWGTTWDSAVSNYLPNAIRITIDFYPPVATNGWYSRPVSASTDRFQHTVALPLAQPYVSSE